MGPEPVKQAKLYSARSYLEIKLLIYWNEEIFPYFGRSSSTKFFMSRPSWPLYIYVMYTIVIFWFKIMENLCLSSRAGANLHSVHSHSVRWKEEWQRQRNSKRKSGVLSVVLKIWNVWHQLCLFYHLTRSRCEGEVGGINVKREETAFFFKNQFL